MKKISLFLGIFLILAVLSGCTSGGNQADAGDKTTRGDRVDRRADFGQPDRPADIMGIVTGLIGNEAKILKIERPEGMGENSGRARGENGGDEGEARPFNPGTALNGGGTGGGRGMMGGGRPGGFGGGGSNGERDTEQMIEMMKERGSTEETVIIPVGIRMLTNSEAAEGEAPEMVEASLADVKKDTTIRVWLNEAVEDRKIAEFVLIF